jgi:hypothetical protein
MHAIKRARKFIEQDPTSPFAKTLAKLVLTLESEGDFPVTDLYLLDYDRFNLALQILREWRIDRYYAGKARLFDVSLQTAELQSQPS